MKIKLFFDSIDEFAVFILSASSITFDRGYQRIKTDMPLTTFWLNVSEIHVDGTEYSVERVNGKEPQVVYKIRNYMLNDIQIENDFVYIEGLEGDIIGSEKVHEQLMKYLPENFLLSEGWQTDYDNYVFRKLHTTGR